MFPATLPLFALVLSAPRPLQSHDELVLMSFASDGVTLHDGGSGAFQLTYEAGHMDGVLGAEIGPDGLLYVCSELTNEVQRFDPESGAFVDVFIGDDPQTPGDETGGLDGPSDIVFGPDGRAYVGSFDGDAVLRYDGRSGAFVDVFVTQGDGNLNGPDAGMTFGPSRDLYVPSFWNNRVKRYDGATGAFVENFLGPLASGLSRPRSVLFPGDGWVYVASEGSDEILRFDALTGAFDAALVSDDPNTPVDESGGLDGPTGMAFGPDGRLYVASIETDSVLRYDSTSGAFVDVFVPSGSGGIDAPTHLFFRPQSARYCSGAPNSVGAGARLSAAGFASVATGDLELRASFCPPGELGIFLYAAGAAQLPLADGVRCVATPLVRLPAVAIDTGGRARLHFDPAPAGLAPGSTRNFQFWYRDPAQQQTGANLSDALAITFGP